jgi:saccharopine dehydrogenase (NAD+, L-lysine-forming)
VVGLKEPQALERSLKDVDLVLHCAGHFARTSPPMLEACLTTGTHYLDITGEIAVFESVMARDEEAKAVGVALLPGVGFDVVPMDCLAASLAEALTDGTHLELAFSASDGSASRATLKTLIEAMPNAGGTLSVGLLRRPGPGGRDRQSALKGGLLWSMWYVGRLMWR